jgi:hypothetical protein
MKPAATKSNLFTWAAARAEENEIFLAAGLDDEGRALRAANNAATDAHLANLRDRALTRAAREANWAWSEYLRCSQATRARRAFAVLGRWKKKI